MTLHTNTTSYPGCNTTAYPTSLELAHWSFALFTRVANVALIGSMTSFMTTGTHENHPSLPHALSLACIGATRLAMPIMFPICAPLLAGSFYGALPSTVAAMSLFVITPCYSMLCFRFIWHVLLVNLQHPTGQPVAKFNSWQVVFIGALISLNWIEGNKNYSFNEIEVPLILQISLIVVAILWSLGQCDIEFPTSWGKHETMKMKACSTHWTLLPLTIAMGLSMFTWIWELIYGIRTARNAINFMNLIQYAGVCLLVCLKEKFDEDDNQQWILRHRTKILRIATWLLILNIVQLYLSMQLEADRVLQFITKPEFHDAILIGFFWLNLEFHVALIEIIVGFINTVKGGFYTDITRVD
jgi:hypothetical protein